MAGSFGPDARLERPGHAVALIELDEVADLPPPRFGFRDNGMAERLVVTVEPADAEGIELGRAGPFQAEQQAGGHLYRANCLGYRIVFPARFNALSQGTMHVRAVVNYTEDGVKLDCVGATDPFAVSWRSAQTRFYRLRARGGRHATHGGVYLSHRLLNESELSPDVHGVSDIPVRPPPIGMQSGPGGFDKPLGGPMLDERPLGLLPSYRGPRPPGTPGSPLPGMPFGRADGPDRFGPVFGPSVGPDFGPAFGPGGCGQATDPSGFCGPPPGSRGPLGFGPGDGGFFGPPSPGSRGPGGFGPADGGFFGPPPGPGGFGPVDGGFFGSPPGSSGPAAFSPADGGFLGQLPGGSGPGPFGTAEDPGGFFGPPPGWRGPGAFGEAEDLGGFHRPPPRPMGPGPGFFGPAIGMGSNGPAPGVGFRGLPHPGVMSPPLPQEVFRSLMSPPGSPIPGSPVPGSPMARPPDPRLDSGLGGYPPYGVRGESMSPMRSHPSMMPPMWPPGLSEDYVQHRPDIHHHGHVEMQSGGPNSANLSASSRSGSWHYGRNLGSQNTYLELQDMMVEKGTRLHREVARPIHKKQIVELRQEVPRPEHHYVERPIEVPEIQYVEKIVEVPHVQVQDVLKHVPKVHLQEMIREVPRVQTQVVERHVEVPQVEYVDRVVEVPEVKYVERVVEHPQVHVQEVVHTVPRVEVQEVERYMPKPVVQTVERIVEVPEVQYVEKFIDVPQVHVQEKIRHIPRIEFQDVVRHVPKLEVQYVEKIVEVPEVQYVERVVEVPQVQYQEIIVPVPKLDVREIVRHVPKVSAEGPFPRSASPMSPDWQRPPTSMRAPSPMSFKERVPPPLMFHPSQLQPQFLPSGAAPMAFRGALSPPGSFIPPMVGSPMVSSPFQSPRSLAGVMGGAPGSPMVAGTSPLVGTANALRPGSPMSPLLGQRSLSPLPAAPAAMAPPRPLPLSSSYAPPLASASTAGRRPLSPSVMQRRLVPLNAGTGPAAGLTSTSSSAPVGASSRRGTMAKATGEASKPYVDLKSTPSSRPDGALPLAPTVKSDPALLVAPDGSSTQDDSTPASQAARLQGSPKGNLRRRIDEPMETVTLDSVPTVASKAEAPEEKKASQQGDVQNTSPRLERPASDQAAG